VGTILPKIDAKLLAKLKGKLKLSQSRVYALIDNKVQETSLPRNVAALLVARDWHVNFSQFAADEDLAMMRGVSQPHAGQSAAKSAPVTVPPQNGNPRRPVKRSELRRRASVNKSSKKADTVFVVHGRDLKARAELTHFLASLEIKILEWNKAVTLTKKPNPYIGEVIDAGFQHSQAIVVLFTPDDEARLKATFVKTADQAFERNLTGQPRQNVTFEAGMALSKYPGNTVLVRVGNIRPMSDIGGLHILQLADSAATRKSFVSKLKIAGVVLNDDGDDWLSAGEFDSL
jgi:predicted nucleotide-binding protein